MRRDVDVSLPSLYSMLDKTELTRFDNDAEELRPREHIHLSASREFLTATRSTSSVRMCRCIKTMVANKSHCCFIKLWHCMSLYYPQARIGLVWVNTTDKSDSLLL